MFSVQKAVGACCPRGNAPVLALGWSVGPSPSPSPSRCFLSYGPRHLPRARWGLYELPFSVSV